MSWLAGTSFRPSLCALRAMLAVLLLLAERSDRIIAVSGELCGKASNANPCNRMQPDWPGVRPERVQRPMSKIILVVFGGLYITRQFVGNHRLQAMLVAAVEDERAREEQHCPQEKAQFPMQPACQRALYEKAGRDPGERDQAEGDGQDGAYEHPARISAALCLLSVSTISHIHGHTLRDHRAQTASASQARTFQASFRSGVGSLVL